MIWFDLCLLWRYRRVLSYFFYSCCWTSCQPSWLWLFQGQTSWSMVSNCLDYNLTHSILPFNFLFRSGFYLLFFLRSKESAIDTRKQIKKEGYVAVSSESWVSSFNEKQPEVMLTFKMVMMMLTFLVVSCFFSLFLVKKWGFIGKRKSWWQEDRSFKLKFLDLNTRKHNHNKYSSSCIAGDIKGWNKVKHKMK